LYTGFGRQHKASILKKEIVPNSWPNYFADIISPSPQQD